MCHIIYCSQSYPDGSVLRTGSTGIITNEVVPVYILKQSHQSKTGYTYMIWHIDQKLF